MKALFISYDGMTDPLGRSQVIPYLQGLSQSGHQVFLLSCEKPERFAKNGEEVSTLLRGSGIHWKPLHYYGKPKFLGPIWNKIRMKREAFRWQREEGFDVVHCRSHLPALIGRAMQRRFGVPFVFDMRGFWADERVDGGIWPQDRLPYRLVYRYFKKKERDLLRECNYAVTLTHRAKAIIEGWKLPASGLRIEVIPCCADLSHFDPAKVDGANAREKLGFSSHDKVLGYLGSVGTWYLLDEMLQFFRILQRRSPEWKLLFVTQDDPKLIVETAKRNGVDESRLKIVSASRSEVPEYLSTFDAGLFFIKPVYSKQASSATKFAELLSMGIPVVTNLGVGDNDYFLKNYRVGSAVAAFTESEYSRVADELSETLQLNKSSLRQVAEKEFSLSLGVDRYCRLYSQLAT